MLWIEEQVKVGVPFALNMLKEGLKEAVKALSEKSEPVSDGILNIREATYWDGLEHGEKRKEIAMIAGMTQIGLEKEQIKQVLEIAAHAWDPISEDKEERGR